MSKTLYPFQNDILQRLNDRYLDDSPQVTQSANITFGFIYLESECHKEITRELFARIEERLFGNNRDMNNSLLYMDTSVDRKGTQVYYICQNDLGKERDNILSIYYLEHNSRRNPKVIMKHVA